MDTTLDLLAKDSGGARVVRGVSVTDVCLDAHPCKCKKGVNVAGALQSSWGKRTVQ